MTFDSGDVVDHLRGHAGNALQAVFVYRGGDHRDLYRRDDVATLHGSELEAAVLRAVRSDSHDDEATASSANPPRATVRVFDARVIVHLPRDRESGTVVALDPAAARNLTDFVADIRADLYDDR